MKSRLLVFATVFLFYFASSGPVCVYAQPYESLFSHGDYSTTWTHKWVNLGQDGITSSRYEKDTVVHGVTYKKVILSNPSLNRPFAGGLFREDTTSGKVWYRDIKFSNPFASSDTAERLAFRFDLKVGDTFDLSHTTRRFPDSLSIVDSVRTINGLKHIYFKAKVYGRSTLSDGEPLTFIEGVGCNLGVLWKHGNSNPGTVTHAELFATYLLCSFKNGVKTDYHNREYNGDCDPRLQIAQPNTRSKAEPSIYLYPQPARGTVRIDNDSGQPISGIWVFTPQGKLVYRCSGQDIKQLDLGDLPAGLYYMKLYAGKSCQAIRPLVIN